MQVFKFGGASVKDAEGVKNVAKILNNFQNIQKVVVVSAMGKMTNALEAVVDHYVNRQNGFNKKLEEIVNFHLDICADLFEKPHDIYQQIENYITDLKDFLTQNKSTNYDYVYDQIICYGELMSTTIVSQYLNEKAIKNQWKDARKFIKTDMNFRDAKVNWSLTEKLVKKEFSDYQLIVTQGFIASEDNNWTTTLGREGSDYTAGILAYCLHAENVVIWKNVDGVLNADPREFEETTLLEHISYQEAIELAFYGASVIHPKTLQPLQRKEIPLYVKSFYKPDQKGTSVAGGVEIVPEIPCFIVKNNLTLISLSTLDFSFFVEENISEVFALFHQHKIKVDLIQNSAISFSVCVTDNFNQIEALLKVLKTKFKVSYNKNVSLYTIRHFDQNVADKLRKDKTVLLEQLTRETLQIVTKNAE